MTIENAKLFIQKSKKLEESPFWNWINKEGKKANEKLISAPSFIMHEDLREEDLESFCLNLRLLIQDRDGLSIRAMKEFSGTFDAKYSKHTIEIHEATKKLNYCLQSKSLVQLEGNKPTTYYEIFDIIFFGGLVHIDKVKRYKFQELESSGSLSWFVFNDFTSAITHYRNCYMIIAYNLFHYLDSIGEINS